MAKRFLPKQITKQNKKAYTGEMEWQRLRNGNTRTTNGKAENFSQLFSRILVTAGIITAKNLCVHCLKYCTSHAFSSSKDISFDHIFQVKKSYKMSWPTRSGHAIMPPYAPCRKRLRIKPSEYH